MVQESNVTLNQSEIEQLKSLIKEDPPIRAWKLGKILNNIYKKKVETEQDERSFFKNIEKTIRITKRTARDYMKINTAIDLEKIKSNQNILLGHLYDLIELDQNTINLFLDAMQLIEEDKSIKSTSIKLSSLYNANDIRSINQLITDGELEKTYTPSDLKEFFIERILKGRIKEQKNKKRIIGSTLGKELSSRKFPEIAEIHPREPIDEQGLVGLFCVMFHEIRDKEFKFGKDTLSFLKIIKIQTPFPDAAIEFKVHSQKQERIELSVEFEYNSKDYISHSHHTSDKPCDLIICWENGWNHKKYYAHILSIKELLKTGNIELHYPG